MLKKFLSSRYSFIFALVLGMVLAVGVSVWATSVGTNVNVTGTLTIGGATITQSVAATTSILSDGANSWAIATSSANIPFVKYNTSTYRIGISTTTPGATFSVGGAGNIYALGGLGVGLATTTAGAIENSGSVLFGDASGDLVMFNAANVRYNNAGTTTLSTSAVGWAFATSTGDIPLLRFDTTNTRLGVGTTTPGATFAVGGDGTGIIMGGATSTLSIQSTNQAATARGGCIELESAAGGGAVFRLYATAAGVPAVWESGSCR